MQSGGEEMTVGQLAEVFFPLPTLWDLDTKTFQEAAAQVCPIFDWFLLWTMGV
jgi:hypothetical protein